MLYLVAPALWLLLASIALAICRSGARSEQRAQEIKVEELLAAGYQVREGLLLREQTGPEFWFERSRRAVG
jgi:hypothetical protein